MLFSPRLVAADPGPLTLITGVTIMPQATIEDIEETDYVLVPNVLVDTPQSVRALDRRLLDWIVGMHRGGAQLLAACGGWTIVLAEAGLLDGYSATTHWMYAPLFRSQYPNVDLKEERILVQAGAGHSIVCAGGASSWQDLTLYLIARHAGTAEAIRISKLFLYQWHRDGQLPYASMIRESAITATRSSKSARNMPRRTTIREKFSPNCSSSPACRSGRSIGGSGKRLVIRHSNIFNGCGSRKPNRCWNSRTRRSTRSPLRWDILTLRLFVVYFGGSLD